MHEMNDDNSFFTDDDMTVETYRVFSPASLAAFLLSLFLGTISLVNRDLVYISVPALIFALYSLVRLCLIKGKATGWILTSLAVFIPIFAMAAPMTYRYYRLGYLADQAIEHSQTWLKLVQDGKVHEPFQLMQLKYGREEPGTDLAVALGTVDNPGKDLEYYLRNEPEITIREDGDQGTFKIKGINYFEDEAISTVEHFLIRYEYTRPAGDKRIFDIDMRRQKYAAKNDVVWNVWRIRNIEPKSRRHIYNTEVYGNSPDSMH